MPAGDVDVRHEVFSGFQGTTPLGGVHPLSLPAAGTTLDRNFGDFKPVGAVRVNDIRVGSANPSASPVDTYFVSFDRPVFGLTKDDFSVVTTGGVKGAIESISGGPVDFSVVVNGVDGVGMLQLNMISSAGVADADGNPVSNVPFPGDPYDVATPPDIVSIVKSSSDPTPGSVVTFDVTFDEGVSTPGLNDFALLLTGNATGTISGIIGGPFVYTVTVSGVTGFGSLQLEMLNKGDVVNTAKEPVENLPFVDESYAVWAGGPAARVLSVQVNEGSAQRSMVTSLLVTLNQSVTFTGNPSDAFQLERQVDGGPQGEDEDDAGDEDPTSVQLSAVPSGNTVLLTFVGGSVEGPSLEDGRYTVTVNAAAINYGNFDGNGDSIPTDNYILEGAPNTPVNLFRMFGDTDGNGLVDLSDFAQFRTAYNPNYNSIFDADGDGVVSLLDFSQFRQRFGTMI
jgi:hypothetical protein